VHKLVIPKFYGESFPESGWPRACLVKQDFPQPCFPAKLWVNSDLNVLHIISKFIFYHMCKTSFNFLNLPFSNNALPISAFWGHIDISLLIPSYRIPFPTPCFWNFRATALWGPHLQAEAALWEMGTMGMAEATMWFVGLGTSTWTGPSLAPPGTVWCHEHCTKIADHRTTVSQALSEMVICAVSFT
jgi:hypothetical protein